jgi:hypothetical protein
MSTTFEVYPRTSFLPSFTDIIQVAQRELHGFFHDFGISYRPTITVEIGGKEANGLETVVLKAPAIWPNDAYAWFQIPPVLGGTDGYFWQFDDIMRELWQELLQGEDNVRQRQALVKPCLAQEHYWSFRRSAGQSATVNVMYGFVASAFAELTEGFIFSDDNAWEYTRFPATAAEFNSWYFRPALALEPTKKAWAERCIAAIPGELAAG